MNFSDLAINYHKLINPVKFFRSKLVLFKLRHKKPF